MKKVFLISVIIFGLINLTCVNAKQEGKSMLKGKPFFSIHYDTEGCAYEIRVNDVPIDSDKEGGPMATTIPIDQWLQSGENTITVYLNPQPDAKDVAKAGQSCNITTKFLVGQNNQPKSSDVPISIVKYHSSPVKLSSDKSAIDGSAPAGKFDSKDKFKEDENGDVTISPITIKTKETKNGQGVILTRTIELKTPFPKWKWLTSDKIENNESTKKELIVLYHNIWQALRDENFKYLKPLLKERANEMAKAMYLPPAKKNAISDFINEVNDQKLELGEDVGSVSQDKLFLRVFGDGKLARLVAPDGGPVIFFNAKDGSYSDSYDFIFRKQDGKWIITR